MNRIVDQTFEEERALYNISVWEVIKKIYEWVN